MKKSKYLSIMVFSQVDQQNDESFFWPCGTPVTYGDNDDPLQPLPVETSTSCPTHNKPTVETVDKAERESFEGFFFSFLFFPQHPICLYEYVYNDVMSVTDLD